MEGAFKLRCVGWPVFFINESRSWVVTVHEGEERDFVLRRRSPSCHWSDADLRARGLADARRLRPKRAHMFESENGGLLMCMTEPDERDIFTYFRNNHGSEDVTPDTKMLFKVTVEDASKATKPVCYVAVPHLTSFNDVLDLFNRKFSASGAFLLKGGYGMRPTQSAGQIFMKYGYELDFYPKVDLSRMAYR